MHDLYKQSNLPYLNVKVCPNCKELVPLNQEICTNCNFNFNLKELKNEKVEKKENAPTYEEVNQYVKNNAIHSSYPSTPAIQVEKNEPMEDEKNESSASTEETIMYCEKCGAKIIGLQKYCGGCGAKVTKRVCPSCKQIIDSSLAFCTYCGEKLINNNSTGNIEVSLEDVNSQIIQCNLDSKKEEQVDEKVNESEVETTQVAISDNNVENNNLENEHDDLSNDEIKMGKKRLVIIIQMLVTTLLLAIMIMVPILTKESLFTSLIPCFTGKSNETIIAGKDLFSFIVESIQNKDFDLNLIKNQLSGENGALIFSGISFITSFLNLFSNPDLALYVSFFVVSFTYLLIIIAMIIVYISSFVGLFKKKPFKGKAMGFLTISFAIGCVFIYFNSFTKGFLKYDSWLVCAFFITFIIWLIVKISNLISKKKAKSIN